MRIVYYTHSLRSCWNHGNAHFLRGVLRELQELGHEVISAEPSDSWSYSNLLADTAAEGSAAFSDVYANLHASTYDDNGDALRLLDGADVVIVHEWTDPSIVAEVGRRRAQGGTFCLLFHDTHHRAVSDPDAIRRFDLSAYDGVLAFGHALAEVYRRWGWGDRAFVWHEAADDRVFRPMPGRREGAVWIGNWGDGERTEELSTYLLAPMRDCAVPLNVFGVRYPKEALAMLSDAGANYRGWLPNARVPEIFAQHLFTVHVPRRYYAGILPGIPTIRVFEALSCGIPLVSAPWDDAEHLFEPGSDYLVAADGKAMRRNIRALLSDAELRTELSARGRKTILARHTCRHRALELVEIISSLSSLPIESVLA